jgi:hypothetical protein
MAVRLRVEIGPSEDELEQQLEIDVDDLLEVIERLGQGPVVWTFQLPDGSTMRLTAEISDTPGDPGTTTP